jgi:hypothetical protein
VGGVPDEFAKKRTDFASSPQYFMTMSAPLRRPRWKNPITLATAAAVVVGVVGGGGYFGVRALLAHPAAPPTQPGSVAQVDDLPAGATACPPVYPDLLTPFNAGARGTPTTSCPFVEQVRMKYAKQPQPVPEPLQLTVVSPSTEMQYKLACVTVGSHVTCAGGAAAVIYLYNKH